MDVKEVAQNGVPVSIGDDLIGVAEASPETQTYWQELQDGRIVIKRCSECHIHLHPRRIVCPECQEDSHIEWVQTTALGTVYSCTTVFRGQDRQDEPYSIGIVSLDEGVHLFGALPLETSIGDRVQGTVLCDPESSNFLIQFVKSGG